MTEKRNAALLEEGWEGFINSGGPFSETTGIPIYDTLIHNYEVK